MFFAQSLGPALNSADGAALHNQLKAQFSGREDIPFDEFRAAITEHLRAIGFFGAPETAIDLLVGMGRVRIASGAKGYVARLMTNYMPERLAS